ncbi:MAG TPA: hypothetical protein VMW35_17850 [Myxococcota bacterium]|jgi:hypothetical protein|nr:hypothetical protein [Myxococcota bacterium]
MKLPGAYKIASRNRSFDDYLHPAMRSARRVSRIVDSLRAQILGDGVESLRIRCVLRDPREIFRVELDVPALGYQRITLLDRDALEQLLEHDDVRALLHRPNAVGE